MIAPDDLYPVHDTRRGRLLKCPHVGKSFTLTWRYWCKMRCWILHTRTGMVLIDVLAIPRSLADQRTVLTLVFEHEHEHGFQTLMVVPSQIRHMEQEGVAK